MFDTVPRKAWLFLVGGLALWNLLIFATTTKPTEQYISAFIFFLDVWILIDEWNKRE